MCIEVIFIVLLRAKNTCKIPQYIPQPLMQYICELEYVAKQNYGWIAGYEV